MRPARPSGINTSVTDKAPVLEQRGQDLALRERVFPAHPFPNARLSGVEDAEELTQIRRIYDMETWRQGFRSERLVVPATRFLEPVYCGEKAGCVVGFQLPKAEVFFVAAIAIKPNVPKTGKRDGFALLTHIATDQVLLYHHRLIVILRPEHVTGYLEIPASAPPLETFDYLTEHRYTGPLDVTHVRHMAKGWEKKIDSHKGALARELQYVQAVNDENVKG